MTTPDRKSHKDWFDRDAATALAAQVTSVYPDFDGKRFIGFACKNLNNLEFNARVKQFSDALHKTLPEDYTKASDILKNSLPKPLHNCESVTDGWLQWPIGQFIADHGIQHIDASLHCMLELTQRFSAEFAVRPFVKYRPEQTFTFLYKNVKAKSPHIRRWCSEGSRTRLPWGEKLKDLIADPSPILPILESLKDDPELYVRKSVANNINDLSKDHPDMVIHLCQQWSKNSTAERDWIIRQGLRSLIKDADIKALKLMGYSKPKNTEIVLSLSDKAISIGDSIAIRLTLRSTARRKQPLLIDYVVHYQGKRNDLRRKVFKWKSTELKPNEKLVIEKTHPMRRTTVRALYPGKHKIELQLNGEVLAAKTFDLLE